MAQQAQISQQRLEAELGKYQRSALEQARRAEFAEAVADELYEANRNGPLNKYAAATGGMPASGIAIAPPVPPQPTAAEIRDELVKQRLHGERLQQVLSDRMTSVQQVVAGTAAEVQHAKVSENTAWRAQLASELRAGRADAAAEAAAMTSSAQTLTSSAQPPVDS